MKLIIKIELREDQFEEICKVSIANIIISKNKITKKSIISRIKHSIHQSGEYYINFTADADNEGAEYYYGHSEEIDIIYNKYF